MKKLIVTVIATTLLSSFTLPSHTYAEDNTSIFIEPQYQQVLSFKEGVAAVKKNGKWGFIDKNNNLLIDYQFEDAHNFSEGLAAVMVNKKWGFIDKSGKMVIAPQFVTVELDFESGIAGIMDRIGNGDIITIDVNGKTVTPNNIFEGGLIGYKDTTNNKYGYKDEAGNIVISAQYEDASFFSEGLARVKKGDKYGFIDKNNNVVIDFKSNVTYFFVFKEGLNRIFVNGKSGLIDIKGNIVLEPIYDSIGEFSEGYSFVELNKKSALINNKGEMLTEIKYTGLIEPFFEGCDYARVMSGKMGLLDKKGKEVVPLKYNFVSRVYNGYAFAREGSGISAKNYLINVMSGEVKLLPYEEIDMNDVTGIYAAKRNGKWGCIDHLGNEIVNAEYDNIGFEGQTEETIRICKDNKWGIISNPLNTPDNWAIDWVDKAKSLKLIPNKMRSLYMENQYKKNITRLEYCSVVKNFILSKTGKSVYYPLIGTKKDIVNYPFEDTWNDKILSVYNLGLISGSGNKMFYPNNYITREEAAVLITNIAKYLNMDVKVNKATFDDYNQISDWAKTSVDFVSSKGIMNGTGNNKFEPNGFYTREQAYITMVKLYNAIK